MSSSDSQDDPSPDFGPESARQVMTPRGGFMARPGLKPPPRHAVVVRGGDAPVSEAIPVARSSFPPPAPSEPEPVSMSEKATLRAIPAAARVPRISSVVFDEPLPSPRASDPAPAYLRLESAPPPSDAPLVQSVPPVSSASPSRRRGSGWAIVGAAAAGLILGLASVLATRGESAPVPAVAAAPASEPQPASVDAPLPPAPAPTPSGAPAAPSAVKVAAPAAKPAAATVKKSIF